MHHRRVSSGLQKSPSDFSITVSQASPAEPASIDGTPGPSPSAHGAREVVPSAIISPRHIDGAQQPQQHQQPSTTTTRKEKKVHPNPGRGVAFATVPPSQKYSPQPSPPSGGGDGGEYFSGSQQYAHGVGTSTGHHQHQRTHSRTHSTGYGASASAGGALDWSAVANDPNLDGYGARPIDATGAEEPYDDLASPQQRRVADEIALQIGMQVSLVYFAFASMFLGVLVVVQGVLLIVKVDGEKPDSSMSWDGVLAPTWILLALMMAGLAAYFIGGFADQHIRFAGRNYDDYQMEMVRENGTPAFAGSTIESGAGGGGDATAADATAAAATGTPLGANSTNSPATPYSPSRGKGHVMRLTKKPTGAECKNSSNCHEPALPAAASCGSGAARAYTEEEIEQLRIQDMVRLQQFLRMLHASMLVVVPAYVLAASLAGRLAGHHHDFSPWVPFSFAFLAEAAIFVCRVYVFGNRDRRLVVVRRIESVPIMCHRGALVYAGVVLSAPLLRVATLGMIAANCAAIVKRAELPNSWAVAFSPLLAMMVIGMCLKVMVVRARQASNRDPDQNPCAVGVVMGVMMMLIGTTLVCLVLWLDGTIDWPLSAVISPALLVALCVAFLGTTLGCFVASAKVELPAEADQITTDAVIRSF